VYFAHPIIVSVVGSFYNGEWSDVLAHGQPGWKDSAPEQLIVLIGTIVCFIRLASPHHNIANNMDSIKMHLTNGRTVTIKMSRSSGRYTSQPTMGSWMRSAPLIVTRLRGCAFANALSHGQRLGRKTSFPPPAALSAHVHLDRNPDTGTHPAPIPTTILLKLAPEAPPEPIPNSSSQFSPQHF